MPTINKKFRYLINNPKRTERDMNRTEFYGSVAWRRTSKALLIARPLCEICQRVGTITPSQHIHHIRTPFDAKDYKEKVFLLFDEGNLMAICAKCHGEVHTQTPKTQKKIQEEERDELIKQRISSLKKLNGW